MNDRIHGKLSIIRADSRTYPVMVAVVAFVFRFGYLWRILQGSYGVRTPPDSSTYLQGCEILWNDPVSILNHTTGLLYVGFTVPFCGVYKMTGGSEIAVVLFHIALSAVTAVLVYYTATYLANRTAGVVAGIAFAVLFDTARFTVFLLSETVFTFTLVLSIWALVRYRRNPTSGARLVVFLSLGWLAITRPFGAPIVAGWVLFELLPEDNDLRTGFIPRWAALATIVGIPLVMFLLSNTPDILSQMERGWREGWIMYKGKSNFVITEYAYTPRPAGSVYEFVLFNLDHVLIMGVLRTVIFFVPLIGGAGFSPFWTGINIAVLGPLILLSLYGLARARRSNPALLSVVAVPLVVVVAIVAVTFISLSWRYRAPLGPVMAILAGYVVATEPHFQGLVGFFERIVPG